MNTHGKRSNAFDRGERRSDVYAIPSWWTIKRWSEFMWYVARSVLKFAPNFTIRIVSDVQQSERV